ncbi:HNH endonuclease [Williamsia deligens]|uniref:DUF222 domain-containing protein n=1 Tax=Williamsia deligens TaxID=321325 RepID=A0ABW3GFU8_9NOCA|nr:HNH endonuclease signature motif containing protein [Williamsia deligens]MCP2195464.1 HNH endonuclease [Williamsia deligens]
MFETVVEVADRLADAIRECEMPVDDEALVAGLRAAVAARNAADGLLARLTGEIECQGTAKRLGMSVRELLRRNGCVPAVASRAIRLGRAIEHLPALARHLRDGSLSAEYADAVARGVQQVAVRTRSPLGSELAVETEASLIGHALAGRTPVEIDDRARAIAVEHEPKEEDNDKESPIPVAENTTLNEVSWSQRDDGRLAGTFDLDVVTGERLISCIDTASRPRPLPDGTPDPRSAAQRRADAFAQVLESASRALGDGGLVAPARTEVILTVPTTAATGAGGEIVPWRAPSLQWLGTVTDTAVSLLSCDAAVTRIGMDIDDAPADITTSTRLFTGRVRKAVIARDQRCIKCGSPGSWTDVHHIVFHSNGGPTTCDNGCLLCRTCHIAVHQHGWEIEMGPDRHPWIRPPATVDPRRELQPAYNRRTLRLDPIAA